MFMTNSFWKYATLNKKWRNIWFNYDYFIQKVLSNQKKIKESYDQIPIKYKKFDKMKNYFNWRWQFYVKNFA